MKILKGLLVALALLFWCGCLLSILGEAATKLVMILLFFIFVWRRVIKNKRRQLLEMSDDDKFDEAASNLSQSHDPMPVLIGGILVYEVEAITSRLESEGVRFCVERDSEDRSFVYGGHGGTGTLMRIRVHWTDREKAVKILDHWLATA